MIQLENNKFVIEIKLALVVCTDSAVVNTFK